MHLAKFQLLHIGVDVAGDICGQALDFHFAHHLVEDAALRLHAGGFAHQLDRHLTRIALSIAMRFRSMCSSVPLMRLVLPVHDHRLGLLDAADVQIEDRVVARSPSAGCC